MKKLLVFTLLIAGAFIITPATHAQSVGDWVCTWDFTAEQDVWQVFVPSDSSARATYVGGAGYRRGPSVTNQIVIHTNNSSGRWTTTFDTITVTFSRTFTLSASGNFLFSSRDSASSATINYSNTLVASNQTIQTTNSATLDYLANDDVAILGVVNNSTPGTTNAIASDLTLTGVTMTGYGTAPSTDNCITDTRTVPTLRQAVLPIYLINTIDDESTRTWQTQYQVPVLAMASGTVIDIYQSPIGESKTSLITIELDDDYTLIQSVINPRVAVGDSVNAGCAIGQTNRLPILDLLPIEPYETSSNLYDVLNGSYITISEYSTATESAYCGAGASELQQCIGDADFTQGRWNTFGNATFTSSGVTLFPGSTISSNMLLPTTSYLEMRVPVSSGNGLLDLQLGDTTQRFNVPSELPLLPDAIYTTSTSGSVYRVSVTNAGSNSITIRYVCIRVTRDEEGNPIAPDITAPTQACVFTNSTFSNGGAGWIANDIMIDPVMFTNNQAQIPLTIASIEQNVSLKAGTYTFTMSYSLITPTGTISNTDNDTLTVQFNYDDETYYIDNAVRVGSFASSNVRVSQVEFELDEDYSGAFEISAFSLDTSVTAIAINSVCISTDQDLTSIQCAVIPKPIGTGVGEWINYLWLGLSNFFECDLMLVLRDIRDLTVSIQNLIGHTVKWQLTAIDQFFVWLASSFFPWLGGYLSNISPGSITVTETCDNIFCVIVASLGVIQQIFDFVNTLLRFVIDLLEFVIEIFTQMGASIFALADTMRLFFDAIANAYFFAEIKDIPILPQCNIDPKSNGFCIVLWMMENTIFSGTGSLIIPLILSFSSIMWLLWGITEIKTAIKSVGSVI